MRSFIYQTLPSRVVFGVGELAQLPQALSAMGRQRALVVSTPNQRTATKQVMQLLGDHVAGIFDRAVMHVPIEIAHEARVQPRTVLYDPQLTLSLPYSLTITSLLNAMAHAAEGMPRSTR